MGWVDTHCHLDAPEWGEGDQARHAARLRAAQLGVRCCVFPAVHRDNFARVRELAHASADAYALGIHPLYVPQATPTDLDELAAQLQRHAADPRLVALGEIGLDYFVPTLCTPPMREKQRGFFMAQLTLAQQQQLPVLLHVRRSADALLQGLRAAHFRHGGIAHAFNGSRQQAQAFLDLGFKLGFGGALTYDRALQLRRLATELPLDALVLETDAPDMPPHWLYVPAAQRAAGQAQGINEPAQLPRIADHLAKLRGIELADLMHATTRNALHALPRLKTLLSRESQ